MCIYYDSIDSGSKTSHLNIYNLGTVYTALQLIRYTVFTLILLSETDSIKRSKKTASLSMICKRLAVTATRATP